MKKGKTNFRFKKPNVQYKNKKGATSTISNNVMTDELALEFLKTNPSRIILFSEYPKDWRKLIEAPEETAKEKADRLKVDQKAADKIKDDNKIKAEAKAKSKAKAKKRTNAKPKAGAEKKKADKIKAEAKASEEDNKSQSSEEEVDSTLEADAIKEAQSVSSEASGDQSKEEKADDKPTEADLNKLTLPELRTAYPGFKSTSHKGYVEKVLESLK